MRYDPHPHITNQVPLLASDQLHEEELSHNDSLKNTFSLHFSRGSYVVLKEEILDHVEYLGSKCFIAS